MHLKPKLMLQADKVTPVIVEEFKRQRDRFKKQYPGVDFIEFMIWHTFQNTHFTVDEARQEIVELIKATE